MDSVIFYQLPASIDGYHSRSIAPRNLISPPLYKRLPSNSARNYHRDSATRRLNAEADTLTNSNDELPSFTDILSRARPVTSRVLSQTIDLTIDSSNNVS
jgi:hypothetical protein